MQEKSERKNILKLYDFKEKWYETQPTGIPGIALKKGGANCPCCAAEVMYDVREAFLLHTESSLEP